MIVFLFLCFILPFTFAGQGFGCNITHTVSKSQFSKLVRDVKSKFFTTDKVAAIANFVHNNITNGFSGNQTAELLSLVPFGSTQAQVVKTIKPFSLDLTCADTVRILSAQTFPSDRLKTLQVIAELVTDLSYNNNTILSLFPAVLNRRAAFNIIAGTKPVSCLFGDVGFASDITFILENSGAMAKLVTTRAGVVPRWVYVVDEFQDVLRRSLAGTQRFDIYTFNNTFGSYASSLQPVTRTSVNGAISYLEYTHVSGNNLGLTSVIKSAIARHRRAGSARPGILLLMTGPTHQFHASARNGLTKTINQWAKKSNGQFNSVYIGNDAFSIACLKQWAASGYGIFRLDNDFH